MVARKSISEVEVELSDDTGFDDASGCHEVMWPDHITQEDARIHLKSGKWISITILVNHKLRK